jgi:CHAT domain-containing protein
VQAAVPEGATLVEFSRYRRMGRAVPKDEQARYAAYVLGRTGEPAWTDLGPAPAIDEAVKSLREGLGDAARRDGDELARALDERVMRPLRAALAPGVRQLLLSPDGALNLVPFGALRDETGAYLVERYEISYLTSGRDLLRLREHAGSTRGALIVADPDFQAPTAGAGPADPERTRAVNLANPSFLPLPGTEEEARILGRLIPGSTVLTGERATKAALEEAASPWLLHVATHGFFIEDATAPESEAALIENPLLRSGLALAGANRREEGRDGLLTALEAAGLDLWGTQLVVLSACDTGVGDVTVGEGIYGLRRALVLAGSETQVLSLWDVNDLATRELMADYYRGLLAGKGRAEALRAVQLKMLASARRKHPAYWAGFIVSGAWGPLEAKR